MRVFVIAAAMLVFLAAPARAQMGGRHQQSVSSKTDQKKPQVDEKAYKAALERIPEPSEKYDPWGGARPTDAGKKSK